jgi:hypothetical protein
MTDSPPQDDPPLGHGPPGCTQNPLAVSNLVPEASPSLTENGNSEASNPNPTLLAICTALEHSFLPSSNNLDAATWFNIAFSLLTAIECGLAQANQNWEELQPSLSEEWFQANHKQLTDAVTCLAV